MLRGAERLPATLRSLTATHLGHDSEAFLGGLAALPAFTRLRLTECWLDAIPLELAELPALEELELGGLELRGDGSCLGELHDAPRLRRLVLPGCSIWEPGELEELPTSLQVVRCCSSPVLRGALWCAEQRGPAK